jgi:hypothetical protein
MFCVYDQHPHCCYINTKIPWMQIFIQTKSWSKFQKQYESINYFDYYNTFKILVEIKLFSFDVNFFKINHP